MKDLFEALFPPGVPAVTRWRLTMFAVVMVLAAFAVWSLGDSGFARADDLKQQVKSITTELGDVKRNVADINVQLIEQSLFDAKNSECTATDAAAKAYFARRVLTLSREYAKLSGVQATIPPCPNG